MSYSQGTGYVPYGQPQQNTYPPTQPVNGSYQYPSQSPYQQPSAQSPPTAQYGAPQNLVAQQPQSFHPPPVQQYQSYQSPQNAAQSWQQHPPAVPPGPPQAQQGLPPTIGHGAPQNWSGYQQQPAYSIGHPSNTQSAAYGARQTFAAGPNQPGQAGLAQPSFAPPPPPPPMHNGTNPHSVSPQPTGAPYMSASPYMQPPTNQAPNQQAPNQEAHGTQNPSFQPSPVPNQMQGKPGGEATDRGFVDKTKKFFKGTKKRHIAMGIGGALVAGIIGTELLDVGGDSGMDFFGGDDGASGTDFGGGGDSGAGYDYGSSGGDGGSGYEYGNGTADSGGYSGDGGYGSADISNTAANNTMMMADASANADAVAEGMACQDAANF